MACRENREREADRPQTRNSGDTRRVQPHEGHGQHHPRDESREELAHHDACSPPLERVRSGRVAPSDFGAAGSQGDDADGEPGAHEICGIGDRLPRGEGRRRGEADQARHGDRNRAPPPIDLARGQVGVDLGDLFEGAGDVGHA
jgi:hypothetical protein